MSLSDTALEFWKPHKGLPRFIRFAGVEDEGIYNSVCRYLKEQQQEHKETTALIENECEFKVDFKIMSEIKKDLVHMNLDNITSNDIVMYADKRNDLFLNALNSIFKQVKSTLPTRAKQENAICEMIVLFLYYIQSLNITATELPKIIYYNNNGPQMKDRDRNFLMLAYCMGIEILLLEPTGYRNDLQPPEMVIDKQKYSTKQTFAERVAKGKSMKVLRTSTADYAKELEAQLFDGNSTFKNWMFQNGTTEPIILNGVLEDLLISWKEEARLREGFKVNGQTVYSPVFFTEIDGVYKDRSKYEKLITKLTEPQFVFCTANQTALFETKRTKQETLKLVYDMEPNGTFKYEKLVGNSLYHLSELSQPAGKLIVNKLNEYLKETKVDKTAKVDITNIILSMSKKIMRLIENYDLPFQIPKLVIFLENDKKITRESGILIEYLNLLGFDIVIFSPAGNAGLATDRIQKFRLDHMVYDWNFDKLTMPAVPPLVNTPLGSDLVSAGKKMGKGLQAFFNACKDVLDDY